MDGESDFGSRLFLGLFLLSLLYPLYYKMKVEKSLFASLCQVVSAAWKNRKVTLPDSSDGSWYYWNGSKVATPTKNLRQEIGGCRPNKKDVCAQSDTRMVIRKEVKVEKSLFASLCQVVSAAWKNRKVTLPDSSDGSWYYWNDSKVATPTKNLRLQNDPPETYRVIKAIYGEASNMDAKVKAGSTSCWMSIVHEANLWVIKAIYGQASNMDANVKAGSTSCWMSIVHEANLCSRGGVEQEQFEELVTLVHDVRLVPMSDRWTWTLANSGEFSVASVRQLIDDKTLLEVDSKTRWIKYVLIKVNVLAWKVKSGSLPTRFNVSRRGIPIDSIKCGICDMGAETSSHFFISCCMVRQTVRLISRWWDISYVEFES
nr:RNA-directed DNA polymerase, eukaryota [Tanacetum cinerariifolium]